MQGAVVAEGADLKAVCSSPRLALHEAVHDIEQLLNALVNANFFTTLQNPLVLPAHTQNDASAKKRQTASAALHEKQCSNAGNARIAALLDYVLELVPGLATNLPLL